MTVQSSTNLPSQTLLSNVNGATSSAKTAASSASEAQDRFMTLLVTQMKNQDPLNPMDNAQVTSQMAQLSTVTGIDKLNTTVESMIASLQGGQSYQAANMIGHNVLVTGNTVSNNGSGGVFGVDLPSGADSAVITIKDGAGATVRTINLGSNQPGTAAVAWDGANDSGNMSPNGSYTIDVKATIGGQTIAANPLSYAQVASISNEATGLMLKLDSGSKVSTSAVKEIF